MKVPHVSLIDYGVGNLWSVVSAIKYLGAKVDLVSDPNKIASSSVLLLPGIGSFRKGMEDLKNTGIDKAIICAVKDNQKLRVQYGKNGKKHKNYPFEDLINFVSHRARKGLILPGVFNKADGIEAID